MAKNIKLSATRISSFLQCKWKYWCNYVLHYPRMDNDSFRLGNIVHETLEKAGNIWIKKEKFTAADKKKFMELCDVIAIREGLSDMSLLDEAKTLVKKRLNDFGIGKRILGLEDKFGFKDTDEVTTENGIPLIGAFDKVVHVDEDTLLIVDYKTSKTAPTVDKLKTDIQLSIYDLVASIRYPQYKRIILALDLLRHDLVYSYRTEEERSSFSDYLTIIHKEMTNLTKEKASASINIFCGWCDYKENCDEYIKICNNKDLKFGSAIDLSTVELIEQWESTRDRKKILEARERELSMIIMGLLQKDKKIANEEGQLYIRQNSRRSYDLQTVYEVVPHADFSKLVSLNKSKVDKYLSDNPVVKKRIDDTLTVNFTSPFIAKKKIKKVKK